MIEDIVRLTKRTPQHVDYLCKRLGINDRALREWVDVANEEGYEIHLIGNMVATKIRHISEDRLIVLGGNKVGRYHVGQMTDTHFGSSHCDEEAVTKFLRTCKARGVETIVCTGDLLDGNKPVLLADQVCSQFDAQAKRAVNVLKEFKKDFQFVAIDGNHDGYFSSSAGMVSGRIIESRMQNAGIDWQFAGVCLGRAVIHGARWQLWHPHGGAGTRNAVRRVLNERAESLEEPCDILAIGHFHKFVSLPVHPENVHCIAGGTFQRKLSEFANRISRPWDIGGVIVSYQITNKGLCTERSAELVVAP